MNPNQPKTEEKKEIKKYTHTDHPDYFIYGGADYEEVLVVYPTYSQWKKPSQLKPGDIVVNRKKVVFDPQSGSYNKWIMENDRLN